ncbi:MAG TPA: DUF6476 family protein [Xanthobacteraceae bacterium]|nr:DUF6476 family protein [Xanthobacteraceae bacterium]
MNNLSSKARSGLTANLTTKSETTESQAAGLVARARTMMLISALTTVLAIAAVVTVIGYRIYSAGAPPIEDTIALPKGARIVSMAGSGGRVAVMIDNNGVSEMRVFDLKTMKESGHLRFTNEP